MRLYYTQWGKKAWNVASWAWEAKDISCHLPLFLSTYPGAPCAACGFERQEGNEAQVAGGGTTKVPCTSVFLCMRVDDQSVQCARVRKDSDSRRGSLHLFLCASQVASDQSTCAFDKADTQAWSGATGELWVDQDKTSRPQGCMQRLDENQFKTYQSASLRGIEQSGNTRRRSLWRFWNGEEVGMSRTSGWWEQLLHEGWTPLISFFFFFVAPVSLSTHSLTDFDMCSWWVWGLVTLPLRDGKVPQGSAVNGRSPFRTVQAWICENFACRNYTQGSGLEKSFKENKHQKMLVQKEMRCVIYQLKQKGEKMV